jgi:hypothetical protein
VKSDAEARICFLKKPKCAGKNFDSYRWSVADMNFTAFAAGDGFHHLHRLASALQNSTRLVEKDPTSIRESDRFCAMAEKRDAELIFEVANLPAQRGLRNVKPRGCTSHVLLFSDRDEVSQVAQFHSEQHTRWVW